MYNYNEEADKKFQIDEVKEFLEEYNLSQYFDIFINEGFDRLVSLFDITESDLISLNVRRGHRRLVQRAIATARGVPISTPILIYYGYDEPDTSLSPKLETIDSPNQSPYRLSSPRRKKRKQYIPSKPVTAFHEFLSELKIELDGMDIQQITTIASEKWNNLSAIEKEKYEREALHANSDYVMNNIIYEDEDVSQNYSTPKHRSSSLRYRPSSRHRLTISNFYALEQTYFSPE